MDIVDASVIVRNNKAYIPTVADAEGAYIDIEPVSIVNLSLQELVKVLLRVHNKGNPKIPLPPGGKFYNLPKPDPVLKAAKVGSWKKLAQGGASYSITWRSENVIMYISKNDKKGRFVWDHPAKTKVFPPDVSMKEVVQAIIDDVNSRPELKQP
jgi:hypothetical protein